MSGEVRLRGGWCIKVREAVAYAKMSLEEEMKQLPSAHKSRGVDVT